MDKVTAHLGFGGAGLTSMRSQWDVMRLLNTAYNNGIRHFDTAPLYGRGYSEMLIGKFAKGHRNNITITTKFGLGNCITGSLPPLVALPLNYYNKKLRGIKPPQPTATHSQEILAHRTITTDDIKTSLERSLQRLNTGYIDYYLLHEGLPSFLNDEALSFLLSLKQRGIVRHIGIATDAYNINMLANADVNNWDVLQYEGGTPTSDEVLQKHPGKKHFHHSCLKHIADTNTRNITQTDKGGYMLAACAATNNKGKVLFATRRKAVLEQNIGAFKKYITA